jgi:putative transposase
MPLPYRRKNALRNGADLTWNYFYMITMRTKSGAHLFGEIEKGKMILNSFGTIANHFRERTELVYSYTKLYEYIIMPDHIHGIIKIEPTSENVKSISVMVKSFKREVTKEIHLLDPKSPKLLWQQSFWARGFKNDKQLAAYEKYIRNNPLKAWEKKNSGG